jgi:phosphoribosyl-ATP pyrophosphohydrolase
MSISELNTEVSGLVAKDARSVAGNYHLQDATPARVAGHLVADSVSVLNTVLDTPVDTEALCEDVGDLVVTAMLLLSMHGLSFEDVVKVAASRLGETFEVDSR